MSDADLLRALIAANRRRARIAEVALGQPVSPDDRGRRLRAVYLWEKAAALVLVAYYSKLLEKGVPLTPEQREKLLAWLAGEPEVARC